MNWSSLIPALITVVVAVTGWLVVHRLQAEREREAKRRELCVMYLIEAYRRLEKVCHRPPLSPEDGKSMESAIADIQLFGTKRQVELAGLFVNRWAGTQSADIEDLLSDLRNSLRSELSLPVANERTFFLRINYSQSGFPPTRE